jgi:hypothetical protein
VAKVKYFEINQNYDISGSNGGEYEDGSLLGYSAM